MKLTTKNIIKGGLSVAAIVAGAFTVNHAKDNDYGKVKVIKIAAGAGGALLGLAGLVHVIDEEFRPEMDEEDTKFDTEDYGEDVEDDFFKDLEEELMDEEEKEVEDLGDEDESENEEEVEEASENDRDHE